MWSIISSAFSRSPNTRVSSPSNARATALVSGSSNPLAILATTEVACTLLLPTDPTVSSVPAAAEVACLLLARLTCARTSD
eukprot:CAMPEP_0171944950 /NCGR_PEP_ID=MMETSP0993-20121228/44841_1 /TAXON_ID=483369 /ORGANISM="non described non described, Strain CCMP2098" /LENGTH=80 /DNA_ID=CAMNT_0012587881 /DNA_START=60 /DNA_END=299 /DNA_ORIENTATION=+